MNCKRYLTVIALLFMAESLGAQAVTNITAQDIKILSVDTLKLNGDVDQRIGRLTTLISSQLQTYKTPSFIFYNLAICYAAKGMPDSTCYYLRRSIKQSSGIHILVYNDPDFNDLRKEQFWETVLSDIDSAYLIENPDITHKEEAKTLYHVLLSDQYARGQGVKRTNQDMADIDRNNLVIVEKFIQDHGWPKFSMVGKEAAKGAFLAIQHSSIRTQNKYFMQLMDAAEEDEATKEWVALLLDRISVQAKGYQYFGTQVYRRRDSITGLPGEYRYFPIFDEAGVDSMRIAFEMPPLKEYLKLYGIDYNPVKK